ncbi:MAG: HAD-IA family hydrolase [Gemmatimonadaceae bacterium]
MPRLALLFDLDGTLIDSIGLLIQSMEFAFEGRTLRPTVAEWTAGIGTPLRIQIAEWTADPEDVVALVDRYREFQAAHLEGLTTIYPGVMELLGWAKARGHAIGLVTSKGRGMTNRSLAHVGLAGLFEVEVTVESTVRHKPLGDPVLYALEQLQIAAGHALFVGDSTHDMHAGKAAGVTTAAALWGPFSRDELATANPDYWLNSMDDLQPVILKLEGRA